MKIVFTGGGSGGHFYPIIAVIEEILKMVEEKKLLRPTLYFASNDPYDSNLLRRYGVKFVKIPSGKMRLYFSLKNFLDFFKIAFGFIIAWFKIFLIYPDVVFGKGGFSSFPTILAAKLWGIPTIIHESDSVPGRANVALGKIADRVAVSYAESAEFFSPKKTAWLGQPIRGSIKKHSKEEAFKFLHLEEGLPVLLVWGGSLGAEKINEIILTSLPQLLNFCQIIHQTGVRNFEDVKERSSIIIKDKDLLNRYHPFAYLNDESLSMISGASDLVISRAGSSIFEIAYWALPSIIIPITVSNGDHQRKNAYNYARFGGAIVIEEVNLSPAILVFELKRLLQDRALLSKMSDSAKNFYKPDAAKKIAQEILNIALSHQS
jgi:UDP-N-acetylglucosamine--N-acetylmuramyl-(pentapeptide) pyrophosphoryl-undecaprenol N-acetylglucosamine transferase